MKKPFISPKLVNLGKMEQITEDTGMENVFTDITLYGLFASLEGI